MTSEVMANGTREKWDPGETEVHRKFDCYASLTLNDTLITLKVQIEQ